VRGGCCFFGAKKNLATGANGRGKNRVILFRFCTFSGISISYGGST